MSNGKTKKEAPRVRKARIASLCIEKDNSGEWSARSFRDCLIAVRTIQAIGKVVTVTEHSGALLFDARISK